jgi:VanZ family protein
MATKKWWVPRRGLFAFLFFFWMALLSVLSLMPMDDLDLGGPEIHYMDKWVHMGFYFTAMLLGTFFLWERFRHRMKKRPAMLWMGIALALYGMIIELLQDRMGLDRSAELADLAANLVGISLGGWLVLVLMRRRESLNWPD